ncbi:MAG: glutathione S-transferase family protein [Deltaproteobacteria bacterium]|nr:glutathione S-transferase family protein [Deltaproteobacteria bacterium]
MLKIYHSKQSRSMRVLWLAEEIGLEYELETLGMFSEEMKRPGYLAIHPLGKVPAIDDDGFVLWETSAILEYLVARYSDGALLPPRDTPDGARAVQWMGYGENPLTVIMGEIVANGEVMPEDMRIPALVDRGREIAPALVGVVERALGERPFILGEAFSAADIMLGFGLSIARYLGYLNDGTPRARDYCERLMARPACQRAAMA